MTALILAVALKEATDATNTARAEYDELADRANGRAAHIADLIADGRTVEQHWIDGYVEAREAKQAAWVAYVAAAHHLADIHGQTLLSRAVAS